MRKVAHFIVRFRVAIAVIFFCLAAVCGLATMQVNVNKDMTAYLPANMQVKQGMDIMKDEFGESTVIYAMVKDLSTDERTQLSEDFADLSLVSSVTYDEDSERYNKGDYAKYSIALKGNQYSDQVESAYEAVTYMLDSRGYEYWISGDIGNTANTLGLLYVAGIILAMIILFTLASSWIEPFLVLITIVVAVLINLGTNLILPSISDTTFSISAILQMVLSMDYLIMLMNLYRTERESNEPELAMENALTKGVSTIASSSVTTVVGLLCLCFMSFTIGADLGMVLAKGVFLSLVCVFAVQPALAIATDRLLFTTAKPYPQPKMKFFSKFSYTFRYPMLVIFLVIFAVGFSMRGITQIDFTAARMTDGAEMVSQVFTTEQQVVVLYDADKSAAAQKIINQAEQDSRIVSFSSYETSVGKAYTAQEMADQMDMEQPLVNMLYYYKFENADLGSLSKDEFLSYLKDGVKNDLGSTLSDSALDSIDALADLIDENVDAGTYTPEQLTSALNKHSVDENTIKLLYLAYESNHYSRSSWTMSLDELTSYLVNTVMNDSLFDSFFDENTRTELTDARTQIEDAVDQLQSSHYHRIIMQVEYASDSSEMVTFLNELRSECTNAFGDSGWYLVGEGPMIQEMDASFADEFNFLSIITIAAILIIVLITFRSIAVPVVLVALIQGAFCWDMILNYALGVSIYYLALLVVQSILMGATIDYAILFTENYRIGRRTYQKKEAVQYAYIHSIRTILMSGSILVVVTGLLGMFATGLTGKICLVISEGSLIAVVLVLLILPGTLMALDRLIVPKKYRA